jgi:hypothetical protein
VAFLDFMFPINLNPGPFYRMTSLFM